MKLIIFAIVIIGIGLSIAWDMSKKVAFGAMVTEQETLDAFVTAQADYLAAHGRYWQGLRTSNPKTEIKVPYYQEEKWGDVAPTLTALPFETEVHQYMTSKSEPGYQVFFYKTELGKNYVKSIGYGVEAQSRTFDWKELKNPAP